MFRKRRFSIQPRLITGAFVFSAQSEDRMMKEYRLTIQAAGQNEADAIESAVRMLNKGASFERRIFFEQRFRSTRSDKR